MKTVISTLWMVLMMVSDSAYAKEWAFNVFLDEKPIGEHTFTLDEDKQVLVSHAEFNVKVLFINAYHYLHDAKETWQNDCLDSLEARTQENSKLTVVSGMLKSSSFQLTSPKGKQDLPTCIMTFAYWNPKMLSQKKLLNPQTGEWLDANIRFLGMENIALRDKTVVAEHYKLEAPKLKIDLWYSPEKEWLALKSITPEGYIINYRLR